MQQPPNYRKRVRKNVIIHYPSRQQLPNYPNWQQPQQLNAQYPPQPPLPNTYYPSQPRQQPPMVPPPPMQSPKRPDRSKLKAWLIIGAIVLAMGLCGGVLSALSQGVSNTSSQTQPTDTPTSTDTFSQIQNQVNQIAQSNATFSKHLDSNYFTYEQTIVITELIDHFAHNNGGRTEAKSDCFDIQKALWRTSSLHLSEIEIHFTANHVDQHGHPLVNMVALCDLKKATAAQFDWSNLNGGTAWDNKDYDQARFFSLLNSQ